MTESKEKCDVRCNRCKTYRYPSQFFNEKGREMKTCDKCREKGKISRDQSKCEHKIQRNQCKECEGSQICEHNRQRSHCKECGGSQICEHKRERSKCKECGGSQICEHKRMRSQCKECEGSQICEHKRIRSRCKECGGSQICEHKRIRYSCKECNGGSICEHKRIRSNCKECADAIKLTIQNWIKHSKNNDKKYNRLDLVNLIDTEFCKNLIEEYPNCIYCEIELQYIEYQDDLATIERVNNELGHIKSNCVIACMKCNKMKVGSK